MKLSIKILAALLIILFGIAIVVFENSPIKKHKVKKELKHDHGKITKADAG